MSPALFGINGDAVQFVHGASLPTLAAVVELRTFPIVAANFRF